MMADCYLCVCSIVQNIDVAAARAEADTFLMIPGTALQATSQRAAADVARICGVPMRSQSKWHNSF